MSSCVTCLPVGTCTPDFKQPTSCHTEPSLTCSDSPQVLLGEIPEFQTQLDAVRATGSALIQHTPDPAEKTRIQSSLAEVNRQFSATQSRVRERSQHLQEASRLTTLYGDGAASVTAWLGEAEAISGAELSWTDFETVNEELKTFQVGYPHAVTLVLSECQEISQAVSHFQMFA